MVVVVEGNLLESPAQVLTNTVNCVGAMGAGIALEFKNRFPAMYEDYQKRCAAKSVAIGRPYLWEDESHQILNFPTKLHWKNPSELSYIEAGLKYLAEHHDEMGISSIAMPALGCGLGGLNWNDVLPLVEKHLGPIATLDVFIYKPKSAASKTSPSESEKSSSSTDSDSAAAQPPLF